MIQVSWHSLALGDVFTQLGTKREGLSELEASRRTQKFGPNKIIFEAKDRIWLVFLRQFLSPLIFLLLVAGVVTILLGEHLDSIVIFGAVIFNTLIGFFQERRALKTFESLRRKQQFFSWVKRDGDWRQIADEQLTPGDLIMLKPGDRVPADARLVSVYDLNINEAVLTGESSPVAKGIDIVDKDIVLAERANMVWMGTEVTEGKAEAIIVTIGGATEFGKISSLLQLTKDVKTPFEKKVAKLGRFLAIIILAFSLIILVFGVLVGRPLDEMFIVVIAVAVSAIPEGLPIAVTVILAISMTRILKKKGLVKRLSATEALGATSVILTDKTGTLTLGEMRVSEVVTATRKHGVLELAPSRQTDNSYFLALRAAALSANAIIENSHDDIEKWRVRGRPTDTALVIAAGEIGFSPDKIKKKYKVINEIPFSSERKFSASLRSFVQTGKQKNTLFFAGAPDTLLRYIKRVQVNERAYVLTNDDKNDIRNTINNMAGRGLRVIMVGEKPFASGDDFPKKFIAGYWTHLLEGAVFLGLIGIKDPVREDVSDTISLTRQAGIRTVIVTGDHALTARSVAKDIGLLKKGRTIFNVMEGRELEEMSSAELARQVRSIDIFARISPEHKVRIVDAWQKQGEVVAMAGDGVNDAPAIKKADIGIAVGTGTDIAKEAADIVLLDNNFSTIVAAVKEGRVIIDNLKKVITYLLSNSFTEIILIAFSLLLGLPLPILPAQILWVNLIEGSFPSIALAFDPAEKDVMKMPPADNKKPLIDKEMRFLILVIGIFTDLVLVGLFLFFLGQGGDIGYIRTIIFVALAINSLFYVFSLRSLRRPIWKMRFWDNYYLLAAVAFGFFLLITAVYLPPLQVLLRTSPLGFLEWIILIGFGILNVVAIEMGKWIFIRRRQAAAN